MRILGHANLVVPLQILSSIGAGAMLIFSIPCQYVQMIPERNPAGPVRQCKESREKEREREKKKKTATTNQPTTNLNPPPPPALFGKTKSDRGSETHGTYAQDCTSCAPWGIATQLGQERELDRMTGANRSRSTAPLGFTQRRAGATTRG